MIDDYLYPGTTVLRNKLGLRDTEAFSEFEVAAAAQRLAEGIPSVPLTPDGLRQLHRHIFQDVFEWAGDFRTVDITKSGSQFLPCEYIEDELARVLSNLEPAPIVGSASQEYFALSAARLIDELNHIHPFREGNGRTMRAFFERFGTTRGREIDPRRIRPEEWTPATITSFETGNLHDLANLLKGAIVAKRD